MSWHGPQGRGAMAARRQTKRAEAAERDAQLPRTSMRRAANRRFIGQAVDVVQTQILIAKLAEQLDVDLTEEAS